MALPANGNPSARTGGPGAALGILLVGSSRRAPRRHDCRRTGGSRSFAGALIASHEFTRRVEATSFGTSGRKVYRDTFARNIALQFSLLNTGIYIKYRQSM